jgi:hypothetical protein
MHRHVTRTCQGKEPASAASGPWAVWADALFASSLQRSDNPSTGQIRQAIAAAVYAFGGQGCAERVAQEFGDHPETAVMRMRWARAAGSEVFGTAPGRARNDPQRRPGLLVDRPRTWRLAG